MSSTFTSFSTPPPSIKPEPLDLDDNEQKHDHADADHLRSLSLQSDTNSTSTATTTTTWTSPDDIFSQSAASTWDTPLSGIMLDHSSSGSSPTEFAFAPPALPDHINGAHHLNNNGKNALIGPALSPNSQMNTSFNGSYMPVNFGNTYGYSSHSSFSSGGSATGSSFSSADALPAISRDFVRPSSTETRRPATAGAAIQGGARFQRIGKDVESAIEEEDVFIDPFSGNSSSTGHTRESTVNIQDTVDPKFGAGAGMTSAARRASDSHGEIPQWQLGDLQGNFNNILHQMQPMQNVQRASVSRPQTSDGLPTYSGLPAQVALPSARTIVGSFDTMGQPNFYHNHNMPSPAHLPVRDARASLPETIPSSNFQGDRAYAVQYPPIGRHPYSSMSGNNIKSSLDNNDITFIGGPAAKKRPRRRYDEIERLYGCGFNGCDKSYGTLNHLNAHVAMQKHGEKRLPGEFKEMRKSWRKKKREAASGSNNAGGSQLSWNRSSISSSSDGAATGDFDRRASTNSMMSSMDYSQRGSIYSSYGSIGNNDHEPSSRPTTASSATSSLSDNRPMTSGSMYQSSQVQSMPQPLSFVQPSYLQPLSQQQQQQQLQQQQQSYQSLDNRRSSGPFHIPMPQPPPALGFRQSEGDHPTPTPENPYPLSSIGGGAGQMQSRYDQQYQQYQQQQQAILQQQQQQQPQHRQYQPVPLYQQGQSQDQLQGQGQGQGFFTLTAPMPLQAGYQQFAFQR